MSNAVLAAIDELVDWQMTESPAARVQNGGGPLTVGGTGTESPPRRLMATIGRITDTLRAIGIEL